MDKKPKFNIKQHKLSWHADLKIRWRMFSKFMSRLVPISPNMTMSLNTALLATVFVVGFGQFTNYVYNSPNIVRGDLLYDWKRSTETHRLAQIDAPADRANFDLYLSNRRLFEAEQAAQNSGYIGNSLFPAAYAAGLQPVKIGSDVAAGLLSEVALYNSLSIEEAKKIIDHVLQKQTLENINSHIAEQNKVISEKFPTTNATPEFEKILLNVQTVNNANQQVVNQAYEILLPSVIIDPEGNEISIEDFEIEIELEPIWLQFEEELDDELDDLNDEIFDFIDELEEYDEYDEEELAEIEAEFFAEIEEELEEIDEILQDLDPENPDPEALEAILEELDEINEEASEFYGEDLEAELEIEWEGEFDDDDEDWDEDLYEDFDDEDDDFYDEEEWEEDEFDEDYDEEWDDEDYDDF
jgi:hypothetical protein